MNNKQMTMMTEQEHNNVQWKKVKLGDCCSINPKTDISKVQIDDIVSFVKMEDVSNDGFITSFSERPYKSLQKKGFTIFQNDDVIFAKITPCMENGKGALVRNMKSKICLGSTEFHVLRACANVSIDFIYQLTISKRFRQRAEMQMTGSAGQQRVPTAFLEDCLISIPFKNNKPDLSTQRRIAAILSSADKVIEQTRQLIGKYKSIKQGLMEDLLKPKEGWKKVKLGDCCETELGKTLDEGRNTGQYRPYLCALNVLWGKIDTTTIKQMRIEDSELERYLVKKGDLLVCEGGEIGRCAIWNSDDEIYYQNALHRVRFYDEFEPLFFMYLLCYYNDLRTIEKYGKGLTIKHLNQTSFRNIPVSVPDLTEQRRIAAILSGIDARIAAEEKVLEKYEKVKKGLMEKLLNE